VTGTPAIIHTLAWLKRHGITHAAIAVHEAADAFVDLIGDGQTWGLKVEWIRDAGVHGTAGAARQLGEFLDETFVVVHGHLLVDDDLAALLDYHNARDAMLTVGLKHTGEPQAHNMVECASTGMVVRFVLRPATWSSEQRTMAPGLYITEPAVLAHIPNDRRFDWEEHLVPLLVAQREPVYAQLLDGQVADLRVPHAYEEFKDTGVRSATDNR
jgi:mannose-1-phosphate guanylyltransferase/phosphomannomutase